MTAEEQQKQRFAQMQAQTQEKTAAEEKTQAEQKIGEQIIYRYCKYCGRPLSKDEVFCMGCGEKHGGEENTCQFCGTITTKKNCPKCQNLLIPHTCPKCGAKTMKAQCACGAILDKKVQAIIAAAEKIAKEPPPVARQMTDEELQKIQAIFKAEEAKPNFKKLQEKLLEREKILGENEYLKKMREEITEVFGARSFKIALPDPEEEAARLRLYSSIEQSIIKKQRRATQEELEALYPELTYIHKAENKAEEEREAAEEANRKRRMEQEKRQKEMEEKYRVVLEEIDKEIEEAKDRKLAADESKKSEEKKRLLAQREEEQAKMKRDREETEKKAKEEAELREKIAVQERAAAEAKARAEADRRAREEAERIAQEQQRIAAAHEKRAAEEVARIAAQEAARIAAQREKERQEAREQVQRQAYLNRMVGTYYAQDGGYESNMVIMNPEFAYHYDKYPEYKNKFYTELKVIFNGSIVRFEVTADPEKKIGCKVFRGEINNDGTVISGNWIQDDGTVNRLYTYYKIN